MERPSWVEIADRVFVRRYTYLDLNVGLVVGGESCLVIDTGSDLAQGREIAAAVREVTSVPWQVVNTHGHFDHCFGNAAFGSAPRWGQRGLAVWFAEHAEEHRAQAAAGMIATGMPERGASVGQAPLLGPDHLVDERAVIDLGGRRALAAFGGRGHSGHDLVVAVPDASVVFWGDLIEVGADPEFDDAFPLEWATTVSRLLDTVEVGLARLAVPGHGDVVGRDVVEEQCGRLEALARMLVEGLARRPCGPAELLAAIASCGYSEQSCREVVDRVLSPSA